MSVNVYNPSTGTLTKIAGASGIVSKASQVDYNDGNTHLGAIDVQSAIEAISKKLNTVESKLT